MDTKIHSSLPRHGNGRGGKMLITVKFSPRQSPKKQHERLIGCGPTIVTASTLCYRMVGARSSTKLPTYPQQPKTQQTRKKTAWRGQAPGCAGLDGDMANLWPVRDSQKNATFSRLGPLNVHTHCCCCCCHAVRVHTGKNEAPVEQPTTKRTNDRASKIRKVDSYRNNRGVKNKQRSLLPYVH